VRRRGGEGRKVERGKERKEGEWRRKREGDIE
jgi:hypothetical protein